MSLSDKAVSGIKYGPIDHGHVIQMLENISKYIDSLDLESAKSAIHSYISDLTHGENKDFEDIEQGVDTLNNPDFPLPSLMNNPEVNSILGEWEKEPEDNEHFGEEQAEGLDNLLEGLRDTPHDNRW